MTAAPIIHAPGCGWETGPYCTCGADPERAAEATRELTPRESRRFERQAAWRYTHMRPRYSRCTKLLCWTCWRDQILGRHRRNLAKLRAMHQEQIARTNACQHEWEVKNIAGREMPHCDKCGTTRWVRG